MKLNQTFSSLFRHYAKHHGLRKEELIFTFTEELLPDDSPASVHLQKNDEILVRKRKDEGDENNDVQISDEAYFESMARLLEDRDHVDCEFMVDNDSVS